MTFRLGTEKSLTFFKYAEPIGVPRFLGLSVLAGRPLSEFYLEPPLLLLQPVLHPTDGVLGSLSDEEAAGSSKGKPKFSPCNKQR